MQSFETASEVWWFLCDRGLAITPTNGDPAYTRDHSHTLFWLGEQRYAIPRSRIVSIQPFGNYEPLPLAQPYIVGTTRMFDRAHIIIDIRPLLMQQRTPPKPGALLIVMDLRDTEIALLADRIEAE